MAYDNLVCEETNESWITDNNNEYDDGFILRNDLNSIPIDDNIIREMINKETDFKPRSDYLNRLRSESHEFHVRNEAIDWIWKACVHHQFGPLCIYLSINYLDRFLTSSDLPDKAWAFQLLAVSCLSLAAKMEETNVPQSIDLQVEDPKFVFEAKTIKRMELLVLNSLGWRMQVVTPFSFIDYFVGKINDHSPSGDFFDSSTHFILNTTREVEFLDFKSSEIAAAAAIAVSGEADSLPNEEVLSSFIHVKKERVVKCLKMMRDQADKINRRVAVLELRGRVMRVPESPNGVLEGICLSYKSEGSNTIGSCTNSSYNDSSDSNSNKRRKLH